MSPLPSQRGFAIRYRFTADWRIDCAAADGVVACARSSKVTPNGRSFGSTASESPRGGERHHPNNA